MFFAREPQTIQSIRLVAGQGLFKPSKILIRDCARLPCAARMAGSDAPRRRNIANSASLTDNASSYVPTADKPFPSCVIAFPRMVHPSPAAPAYVFQHAHPSAHATTP